ncbi:MAG: hypothetical protein JO250_03620 [Armatimonadetes bacterium]|nr:hypothetical protein [Armatimonadota bacterium]
MLAAEDNLTLPGWRDFERSVALAFSGRGSESKAVFDVLLTDETRAAVRYGLSCKMRKELNRIRRDGRVTIELSNSAGQFWDQLAAKHINPSNYRDNPQEVGITLIELVQQWHLAASIDRGGLVNLAKSYYLVLSWNNAGLYQLHQFSLALPDPTKLRWYCPVKQVKGIAGLSRRINGDDEAGTIFEWYGESGGQLKYYPPASTAVWQSEPFRLEALPDVEHGILAKVAAYFPGRWAEAVSGTPS